jgi:perosamine synthetase
VSKNAELTRRIEILRSHGAIKGELYLEFIDSGFNFRLSDISAAMGVAQMTKLKRHISDRIKYANSYKMNLELCPYLVLPSVPDGYVYTFQSYVIRLSDHFDRDEVIRRMKKVGIETTLGTYSISSEPYFQGYIDNSKHSVCNSEKAFSQSLTLPLYPGMGSRRIK